MRYREISEGKGVSDFKGLRDYAIAVFDRKFDKLYPKGKTVFNLPTTGINVMIKIGPGLTDELHTSPQLGKPYTITMNSDNRSKLDLEQVLAHEITHVAQHFNKFTSHADQLQRKFDRQNNINSEWESNKRFHKQNPTEQEARLAEVLILMRHGEVQRAGEELYWEAAYFQFSRRDWLRKAVAFGISPAAIKATEAAYRAFLAKNRGYLTTRPDILDKVTAKLAEQPPLWRMLGMSVGG